jgi:hypothetical protein
VYELELSPFYSALNKALSNQQRRNSRSFVFLAAPSMLKGLVNKLNNKTVEITSFTREEVGAFSSHTTHGRDNFLQRKDPKLS